MSRSIVSNNQESSRFLAFVLPVAGGVLIALMMSVFISGAPSRYIIALFGVVLIVLPVFVIKDNRMYGIGLYLLLFIIERNIGKNLTKTFINMGDLIDTYGIPPMSTISVIIRPTDVVLLCLVLPWILNILTKKERFQLPVIGYLPFAYLVWAAVSSVFKARYPFLSVIELVEYVKFFILFVYVANVFHNVERVRVLIGMLMISLFLEGLVSFIGLKYVAARHLLGFLSDSSVGQINFLPGATQGDSSSFRAVGTFGNFAVTAMYMHFVLPLAFTQWAINLGNRKQWIYLGLIALGVGTLWITYSRTGLISAAFALTCCAYLCHRMGFLSNRLFFALFYMVLLTCAILSPKVYKFMLSRPTTLSDRMPIVKKGLTLISNNLLLGVGLNNSTAVKKDTFTEDVPDESMQPIHNHYLVVATESGIIGLILFFGFFVLIGKLAFRQARSPTVEIATFAIAILSSYVGMSVHLLGDAMFSRVPYGMLMFYAGLVIAFSCNEQADMVGKERLSRT